MPRQLKNLKNISIFITDNKTKHNVAPKPSSSQKKAGNKISV